MTLEQLLEQDGIVVGEDSVCYNGNYVGLSNFEDFKDKPLKSGDCVVTRHHSLDKKKE